MARRKISGTSELRATAVICVPYYQDGLAAALTSLIRQSLPRNEYEILIVCDETDEATRRLATGDEASKPRVVASDLRKPSELRRLATEAALAPIVAFLSPRAAAEPRWLENLCQAFDELGDGRRIMGGQVKPAWTAARPAWLHDELLAYLSIVDLGEETRFVEAGERLSGANFALRKKHVGFTQLFDQQLDRAMADGPPGVEDAAPILDASIDLGAGIFYCPSAIVQRSIPPECLTQGWFRRRAAWQASVDRQFGPPPSGGAITERWKSAKDFLYDCPPNERTVRGLILGQKNARRVRDQFSAIYDSVYCLLSGVRETVDE